jgi:6-phosphogluconolactonase
VFHNDEIRTPARPWVVSRLDNFSQEPGMLKQAAAALLIGAATVMWVGCVTNSSSYLYASLPQSSQMLAYREDPNSGILTQLAGSPITASSGVHALAIHPSKKFLYAVNTGSNSVSLFTIGSGGGLVQVTPDTVTGSAPTLIAIDSAGKYLYVGNSLSGDIYSYSIDATNGSLTQVSVFSTGLPPLNMKVAPSGDFLYLTLASTQSTVPGLIEVLASSAGVLSIPGTVNQFPQTGAGPYGLAITPSGSFLYVSNFSDNTISQFGVNSNGSLTSLGTLGQSSTYSNPIALLTDTAGKYLFVANSQSSGNISGYSIGSSGGLALVATSPFVTAAQPAVLAIDAGGKYVFVGNQGSSAQIQSFTLDPGSGTLTIVASYQTGSIPSSIVTLQ